MKEKINQIKQYIKNNKLYVIAMIIGTIAFTIQVKFVTLYADDILLGVIAKEQGIMGAFKHLAENYMTWGGGPTPFIVIIFMLFELKVWKLFNCIITFSIVHMSVQLIAHKSKINKGIIAAILWCFIFILHIEIARETIYWMDGYMAYVFIMFQLLLYIYYVYSKFVMGKQIKKYDYILLPIVAFFSGWTGPQGAILTVLFGIAFIIWKKCIKKEKIPTLLKVAIVFSIIGCLVEVLAPGNSVRMEKGFPEFASYGIIEKIEYRISNIYSLIFKFNYYGLGSLAFFSYLAFGIIATISYKFANKEENKKLRRIIKILSVLIIVFIAYVALLRLNLIDIDETFKPIMDFKSLLVENINIEMIIPYIITSLIMLITCILAIYISVKKKDFILCTTYILGLMAHGIMIVSPYSPLRSTFFSIALLWISIACLIKFAYEEKININYMIILVLGIVQKELRNSRINNLLYNRKYR
ncbi:MAG: hypothetical protein HFJ48_00980 [Clostridia bacterium]|nr:hypothetical protein [Clostridia bacterium]